MSAELVLAIAVGIFAVAAILYAVRLLILSDRLYRRIVELEREVVDLTARLPTTVSDPTPRPRSMFGPIVSGRRSPKELNP